MRAGWTQERLAEIAGVHTRTLQRVENDGVASLHTLHGLARALDQEPISLLAEEKQFDAKNPPVESVSAIKRYVKESERIERWLSYGWLGTGLLALGWVLLISVIWMVETNLSRSNILNVLLPGTCVGLLIMGQGAYLMSLARRAHKEKRILHSLSAGGVPPWPKQLANKVV